MQAPGQYWPLRWPDDILGTIIPDPAGQPAGEVMTTNGTVASYEPVPRQVPVPTALTDGQLAAIRSGAWTASSVHLSFSETVLVRTSWVAGPGCNNSGDFPLSIDGNTGLSFSWTPGANQAVGQRYSADFGSAQSFGKVTLYTGTSTSSDSSPGTFKVEHSLNGTDWTTAHEAHAGVAITTTVLFGGNISARYIRLTIVTINPPGGGSDWRVNEFNAYRINTVLASDSVTTPLVVGGAAVDSKITYKSTTGAGTPTGIAHQLVGGTDGATVGVTVLNDGNVGFGTAAPQRRLHSVHPDSSINTHLALENPDTTDGNGGVVSFRSTTTGGGGAAFTEFAAISGKHTVHDHATRSGELALWTVNAGTLAQRVTILSDGKVGIGIVLPASLLDLRSGDQTFSGENGQMFQVKSLTELTVISAATQATTIQIPADAVVLGVSTRVTIKPGGTNATFTVTATTSATAFQKGASISSAATTTDPGTKNTPVNYNGVAAQTVTLTFDGTVTDNVGRVRVTIYFTLATAPTS